MGMRIWGFSSWVQMWEIQLIVLLESVILKTTALDFKRSRMQSMQDSRYWHISHYVPDKHQWFVLTSLYLASSIFTHIAQNIAQSLVQLRVVLWWLPHLVQLSNTAAELWSTAAPWETDSVTKWHHERNHWHSYREIPPVPYIRPSPEKEWFTG